MLLGGGRCPFSLNEDDCNKLFAVPVSVGTVHFGVKSHNEGIALYPDRTGPQQEHT